MLSGGICGSWVCVTGCDATLWVGQVVIVVFVRDTVVGSFGYGWCFGGGIFSCCFVSG